MNAKNLIAALTVMTAAGSAFAESTYPYVDFGGVVSTKTRAEVVAETKQQAVQPVAQTEWVDFTRVATGKTRAEVRAELAQARAEGQLAGNQEYVDFTHVASTKSRAQVREEMQASRNGAAPRGL
ncbi:MAG: DUF4148 domain-containing protein [Bacillota bacterium]